MSRKRAIPNINSVLLPLGAVGCLLPFVPSPLALLAGVALALAWGNTYTDRTKTLTPHLMAISISGLGAGMNLVDVGRVGLQGLSYTALGISMAFVFGTLLNRLLKTDRITSTLISAGTAICGGSAIAAVAPVLKAKSQQISVALGVVFLLNAAALIIFPWIGQALGLTQVQFGLWSALAIHDTSSVVGASMQFGPEALKVGTTVKLARALWIVPLVLVLALVNRKEASGAKFKKPWFILGFVIMAALVTWIPELHSTGLWVAAGAKRLFVMALFIVGASFTRQALNDVGYRILIQAIILWLVLSTGSLAAIHSGWL